MPKDPIQPIDARQEDQVRLATRRYIDLAATHFHQAYAPIPVHFNLRGRSAGQFRAQRRFLSSQYQIRYNPWVFALDFTHHLADTVPHEVAHYITHLRHPRTKPHGREWKSLMQLFGATPRACSPYRIEGIPLRQQRRHDFQCLCHDRIHAISTTLQKRILQGRSYICRDCHGQLRPVTASVPDSPCAYPGLKKNR